MAIAIITAIITAISAYYAYLQWKHSKNEKPIIINVPPPNIDLTPQIHIELPGKEKNENDELKEENIKKDTSYQPLDDEFYIKFGCDVTMSKKGNDTFSITEE